MWIARQKELKNNGHRGIYKYVYARIKRAFTKHEVRKLQHCESVFVTLYIVSEKKKILSNCITRANIACVQAFVGTSFAWRQQCSILLAPFTEAPFFMTNAIYNIYICPQNFSLYNISLSVYIFIGYKRDLFFRHAWYQGVYCASLHLNKKN